MRISTRFAQLRKRRRPAFVAYMVAGDPQPAATATLMHALVRGGADMIELGYPFSDPMAEGPVIQRAHERSLAAGTTLNTALQAVARFREQDEHTPVVLMGYANPIEQIGHAELAAEAARAGADGLLVVDLPLEAAREWQPAIRGAGLEMIFLIAPTTSELRTAAVVQQAGGFIYYIGILGVTGGAKSPEMERTRRQIEAIKRQTDIPVCVGFGIKNARQAAQIGELADGVVVGSALVSRIGELAAEGVELSAMADEIERLTAGLCQNFALSSEQSRANE